MQQKIFSSLILEVFGKQAGELASFLFEKKNVNEFLIAKKLKLTPNQARNILYKFSHLGIASFTRKKDRRKGWYTYFWTLDIGKTLEYIKKELEQEFKTLEEKMNARISQRFYTCPICKVEVTEENALLHDFVCPECGSVYELSASEKIINEIKTKMKAISNKLLVINTELEEIEKRKAKVREREIKKAKRLLKRKVKAKKAKGEKKQSRRVKKKKK